MQERSAMVLEYATTLNNLSITEKVMNLIFNDKAKLILGCVLMGRIFQLIKFLCYQADTINNVSYFHLKFQTRCENIHCWSKIKAAKNLYCSGFIYCDLENIHEV